MNRLRKKTISRRKAIRLIGSSSVLIGSSSKINAKNVSDVIIIGAGFSGLNAGIILADEGLKVTVLEASSRVGGRAFTADHIYGKPELGASQIGPYYARIRDMAHRLGVKLQSGANINAPFTYAIGDTLIRREDWEGHALNKTVGRERQIVPSAMQGFYVGANNPLKDFDDWLDPEVSHLDVPLASWLIEKGISEEALHLVNQGLVSPDAWNVSLLRLLQEEARGKLMAESPVEIEGFDQLDRFQKYAYTSSRVEGGTSRLPEAMANFLSDKVKTNKIVSSMEIMKSGIEVECLDGASYAADFAISAIPFGALRRISMKPSISGEQAAAVRHMPYANNTQVHIRLKGAPFWEQDGMDASLWTDGPITIVRQPIGYDGSRDRLMVICAGKKGERIDQLSPEDRGRFVIREIEKIRPSTKGKLEVTGVHSWPQHPFIYGCGHSYGPGQVTRFAKEMIKPHGRLHFAGEHTRRLEIGMESAMESGERAAYEILDRIG